jgi:CubicO group peptidase (beta-lactamase class C family)
MERLGRMATLLVSLALCACAGTVPRSGADALSERVDAAMAAGMAAGQVPGAAVAVLRAGQLIHLKGYGSAQLEWGIPVTTDAVFELASVTKSFTAAAVLLLESEGRLSLDDPLSRYVDDTPAAWAGITLRHLVSHTAGLEHRFEQAVDGSLLLDYSTEALLRSARATPTFAAPGQRFRYSDQGYFLLGLVIERVHGKSYADFLAGRFFAPLGMANTGVQDQARIWPKRVAGYTVKNGSVENIRRAWQFGLTSHFGILSTVEDLAKWEQALWTDRVLPAAVRQRLWEPLRVFRGDPARGDLLAYGHGWWVITENGHRMIEHSGFTGTHYFRDATSGLSVIVLTNRDQPSGPGTVTLARAVARVYEPTIPAAPP